MQENEFDINTPFQVRRISSYYFAISVLFFISAFAVFIFFISSHNPLLAYGLGSLLLAIAVYNFTTKHKSDDVFIEVDVNGIWLRNKEITNWSNYKWAHIDIQYDSDYSNYSSRDFRNNASRILNRVIKIEHYKDGESGYFIHELFFNGNEDKVEEDVINAIEFFYNNRFSGRRIHINPALKDLV